VDFSELLHRYEEVDLLRFTTVGSVDDGKSTLIGRLLHDTKSIYEDQLSSVRKVSRGGGKELDLSYFTDGLKAEREQGITIDVAYRHFSTPRRRFIIADTPGHEQYTRNMVTGASTADLAVILVDARKGLVAQSKRHGFIASLLGVQHMVVAVNKMDLVDYRQEVFDQTSREYSEFAAKLTTPDLVFIPISALKGDNVVEFSPNMPWYGGPTLLSHLETVHIGSDRNLIDFRFPVQYVLRPNTEFRGYSGQVVGGVVRVGDAVVALPSGKGSRVKRIVTADGDLAYAFAPQSVTLCLEDEIDLGRGDMLVHPANRPRVESEVEAMLVWMDIAPLQLGKTYLIKHTTQLVRGEVASLHYRIDPSDLHRRLAAELQMNDIGRCELRLHRPLLYDEYARNRRTGNLILIDPLTNNTAGAGMIIDRALHRGEPESTPVRHITVQSGHVAAEDRAKLLGQRPATLWLTGLSGSGKTALAYAVEKRLVESGHAACVLDGDNIRDSLNKDLGFCPADRKENIRRVAEVARLFNDAGLIVVVAFISPYREDRDDGARVIGTERFIEVFVDAPLDVCEERDAKGLYRKARTGEIKEFTGVSAPYEPPVRPQLHVRTDVLSIDEEVELVVQCLRSRGILTTKPV
jgi:bifunctional enzyme CysN/CysC